MVFVAHGGGSVKTDWNTKKRVPKERSDSKEREKAMRMNQGEGKTRRARWSNA
jgi:hypothetical protein